MIDALGENLVFLLGVPRSGTTLLCAMLDRHPSILCPPEPWIMLALTSLGQTPATHPADPQLLGDATRAFCDGEDADEATRAFAMTLLNRKLITANRSVFIDKTPRYLLILRPLRRLFPKAKFVWLIRNPLDVAASYLSSWKVDIAKQVVDFPQHRACIDLVVGLRELSAFNSNNDCVYSLRYEDLVASPDESVAKVLQFLALPAEPVVSGHDLSTSPLARSSFGDQNIRQTDRPHQRSVDSWQQVLTDQQLQILLDVIGATIFEQLGYQKTLGQLAERGIYPGGIELTTQLASRVEAGLAEREAEVQAASTLRAGANDESKAFASMSDLHPTAFSALLAELRAARLEIPRLNHWAISLEERLAHAEVLADQAEGLNREMAVVRQQNEQLFANLSAAQNENLALRAAKEQWERPGALLVQKLLRLKRGLQRFAGKTND